MLLSKKVIALSLSALAAITAASTAQVGGSGGQTLVVNGSIDWLEKSDVSALKDGVLDHIEYQIGQRVEKGAEIGGLHDELARFSELKAKIQAENKGEIAKAEAARGLANAEYARIQLIKIKNPNFVSKSEEDKAIAEVNAADAQKLVAQENQKVYAAEYQAAKQLTNDHKIIAPFDGVITDRMKNPGEAVHSNEAVVRVGRTDTLRFIGWIPLNEASKIKGNEPVEVRVVIDNDDVPIETKKFPGRVTSISREVNSVRLTEVQIMADIYNDEKTDQSMQLLAGMKVEMTIKLGAQAPDPKVAAKR